MICVALINFYIKQHPLREQDGGLYNSILFQYKERDKRLQDKGKRDTNKRKSKGCVLLMLTVVCHKDTIIPHFIPV